MKSTSSLVLGIALRVMVNSGHDDGKPRRKWEWKSLYDCVIVVVGRS